jgi:hypothetical protein
MVEEKKFGAIQLGWVVIFRSVQVECVIHIQVVLWNAIVCPAIGILET